MDKFAQAYIQGYRTELQKSGGVGSFLYDMFIDPAVGMVRDPIRAVGAARHGNWGQAGRAAGSFVGNTALTGLNVFGGLGSLALKGVGAGLRGLGWLAKATPVAQKLVQGAEVASSGAKTLDAAGHAIATAKNPVLNATGRVMTGATEAKPLDSAGKAVHAATSNENIGRLATNTAGVVGNIGVGMGAQGAKHDIIPTLPYSMPAEAKAVSQLKPRS